MRLQDRADDVRAQAAAKLIVPGFTQVSCTATEISDQGATLKVTSVFGFPQTFEIVIGTRRHECEVVQKSANKLRVSFRS